MACHMLHERIAGWNDELRASWMSLMIVAYTFVLSCQTVTMLLSDRVDYWAIVFCAAVFVSLVLCLAHPVIGGMALIAVWIPAFLMPVTLPDTVGMAVMIAIIILAHHGAMYGGVAVVLASGTKIAQSILQQYAPHNHDIATYAGMIIPFVMVAGIGFAIHSYEDLSLLRFEEHRRRERLAVAQTLHDFTCNDITCLIMMIDSITARQSRFRNDTELHELAQMRALAVRAMEHTHAAVRELRVAADERTSQASSVNDVCDRGTALRHFVNEQQDLLTLMDRHGTVCIEGDASRLDHMNETRYNVIMPLLRELCGNILKHAEPKAGYSLIVGIGKTALTIWAADRSLSGKRNLPESVISGTGMAHYQQVIENMGGSFSITDDGREWSFRASIPYFR